jgi:hypothetical protein
MEIVAYYGFERNSENNTINSENSNFDPDYSEFFP